MFKTIMFAAVAVCAAAQTQVDLRTQAKEVDFRSAKATMPVQTGTALPANCTVGQLFFKTDAPKGANLYACAAANTWSVQAANEIEASRLTVNKPLSELNAYYSAGIGGNVQVGGAAVNSPELQITSDGGTWGWPTIGLNAYNGETGYGYPWFNFKNSRGTEAQPMSLGSGQSLGSMTFGGQSGLGYRQGAELRVVTTDDWNTACTPEMGAWCNKTKMELYTRGSDGRPTLTLNDDHSATVTGDLAVGGKLQLSAGVEGLAPSATTDTTNPANIHFAQNGPGAVERTIEAKLRESVSLADFGADPTGSNDSAAAINAAISSGAKDIYIPAGTYRVTQTLLFSHKEGLSFHGVGPGIDGEHCGSRFLWSGAVDGVVIEVLNTSWSRLSGFCVDGDGKAGTGIYVSSNNAAATQRNLFEHISVQNVTAAPGYGWRVGDGGDYDVSQNDYNHVTVYNCARGLQQEGGQTVSNNFHDWTISGIEGNQYGAYFEKGSIDFTDFTLLGPASWLAHVYVASDVLWASGTNILHEHNGSGPVYLFAAGERWWPTTFQRLRVLNHGASNPRLLDYEQSGQFTCTGCSFESYAGSTFLPATLYFHPITGDDYTGVSWFGSKKDESVTWDIGGRIKWRTDNRNMNPGQKTGYEFGATTPFDARLLINDPSPNITLKESDAAADNKYWDIRADSNVFSIGTANDAYNTRSNALTVTRSGNTVTQTAFPNGRVGIGTTEPTRPLDITVSERWNGPVINNTAGNPYLYLRHGIGAEGHKAADLNTDGDSIYFEFLNDAYTAASPSAAFSRGGTVKLGAKVNDGTMDAPVVFVGGFGSASSGNVGIGTTSPSYPLDVNGAVRASSILTPGTVTATGLTLNGGTGGPHQVLKQSTTDGTITVGQMAFSDLNGSLDLSGPQVANTLWNRTSVTTVSTAPNNTAEQNLMSIGIPAGQLNTVGKTLHVYGAFNHSTGTAATGALTFRAKLCAVQGCASGAAITLATWISGNNASASTNVADDLEFWAGTASTGAAGTIEAHGTAKVAMTADAGASPAVYLDGNSERSAPFDLSAPAYLQITVTCSTNGSTPSVQTIVTQRLLFAEIR